jgi:hypothetical protein
MIFTVLDNVEKLGIQAEKIADMQRKIKRHTTKC